MAHSSGFKPHSRRDDDRTPERVGHSVNRHDHRAARGACLDGDGLTPRAAMPAGRVSDWRVLQ